MLDFLHTWHRSGVKLIAIQAGAKMDVHIFRVEGTVESAENSSWDNLRWIRVPPQQWTEQAQSSKKELFYATQISPL